MPYGHYANPEVLTEAHLYAASDLLRPVEFRCCDFAKALQAIAEADAEAEENRDFPSFVYADPPYAPETETSFVQYTADGFTRAQHEALFSQLQRLPGTFFLLSNADVPLVRDAFPSPPFHTRVVSCRRAIHSTKPGSRTNEVLIRNYHL